MDSEQYGKFWIKFMDRYAEDFPDYKPNNHSNRYCLKKEVDGIEYCVAVLKSKKVIQVGIQFKRKDDRKALYELFKNKSAKIQKEIGSDLRVNPKREYKKHENDFVAWQSLDALNIEDSKNWDKIIDMLLDGSKRFFPIIQEVLIYRK